MNNIEFVCQLISQGYLSLDENGRLHKNIDRLNGQIKYIDKIIDREKPHGYMEAGLNLGGKIVQVRIHRVIWTYFNEEIPEGVQINHRDGNKINNSLENLELATPKENIQHALNIIKTIKKHWKSKLSKLNKQDYILMKDMLKKNVPSWEIIRTVKTSRSVFYRIRSAIKKGIEGL